MYISPRNTYFHLVELFFYKKEKKNP